MQQRFQTASLLGPLLFLSVLASAQPFITNWVPADTDITIPTNPAFAGSYDYSYTITNISGVGGDASSSGETSTVIISGLTPGDTYRVEISGDFPSIYFNNNTAISSELISIEQWGAIAWQSMFRAFSSCSNLQLNATDQPDFTNTTDLSFMFLNASTVDADISDWDVSTITNMSGMFNGATNFNNGGQPLDWANTGLVQNMSSMFTLTSSFNQDVSGWDVSSVTTMRSMFAVATGFNNGGQPLDWVNTGMLATTQFMFFDATSFDQPLGTWDISNVTNMSNMLDNSAMSVANYDATLIGWEAQAPGNVVTLGATGLQFCSAATAHANLMSTYGWTINDAGINCTLVPFITTWQTDNPGSSSANQITIPTTGAGYNYDVSWFEVGNPANNGTSFGATGDLTIDFPAPGTYRVEITGQFPRIFFNAASFSSNKDSQKILTIEQWGSIAWTSMASAFAGCENLVINAADAPDLSGVTDLSSMFREAYVLNSNISHWDVSTITNMSRMFRDATSFNQPLNSWDVSGVTDMSEMFFFASVFNQNLNNWQVDNVTNMDSMFGGALAFNGDVSTWHVDNVTDLSGMFSVAEAFNNDISGWQITSATNLSGMFNGAIAFNQDISTKIGGGNNGGDAWDTNGVLNMAALFKNADAFVQPIINWDVSTVTNMREMFAGHDNFNQDISGWTVDNVTNMEGMFAGASAFNQDISGWNTALVNDMSEMFENATSFNQDLGRVGGWDVSGVSDMRQMFRNASSFDQNLGGWDFSNLSGNDLINFLNNSGLSVTNYDNLLIGLDAQIASLSTTISNFGAQNIYYCGGESARAALLAHGWTFDDGGLKCISIFEGPDTASPEIVNGQPEAIEYGSTSTTKSKTYTIVNNQASPLVDVTISNPGVGFPTSVIIPTLGSGLPQNFTVDLTGPVGTYLETITITNATIPTVFTFDVHGEVTVTPEPEISVFEGSTGSGTPILNNQLPSFFLGTELRGNSLTRDFSIKNIGDAPLNITDISFPPGSEIQLVSIPPTSIPVDGVEIISLIITGTNAGAFLEQLSITSDDTDEPVFSFFVFAQIEGPDIWVVDGVDIFSDPEITNGQITPIDIGSGTFGTDVVKQLTITDATPVNLAVFDISISGTAFTFTPAAPFGVAGAVDGIYDEVLLEITLSGTTPGTFNEVVTITSDDEADPVFTFPITGTITSTGCTTLPTVNAGTDVSLCTGNTIALSGTIGGSATTATWSTAGTGTFDDNTLLNATYTFSGADVSSGSVLLTLTVPAAGPCPQVQDQLVVSISSAPIAGSPSVQGDVGIPANIDVISNSTIGSGDVITVTIQNNPSKGSVTINTDKTISYTASTGTIGADSFDYEICNQCSLCSSGTISIDIVNAAPVFTAPSTTPEAAPGQTIIISIPDVVSDLNNNIDLSSFSNFSSTANAAFSYDTNTGDLTLDYTNAAFTSAQDNISFTICDLLNSCTDVALQIDLNGEITVFNGVSPNGDGMNDFFNVENIQFIEPINTVTIYNRWGDKVYEQENYNSDDPDSRFDGRQNDGTTLPSGVYFYKIEIAGGKALSGYLSLKK